MSTIKHESAHLGLGTKFMFKLAKMGISDDIIRLCGATTYRGRASSKEGNSTYRPPSRRDTDWPTFAIESDIPRPDSISGIPQGGGLEVLEERRKS